MRIISGWIEIHHRISPVEMPPQAVVSKTGPARIGVRYRRLAGGSTNLPSDAIKLMQSGQKMH
jgi:hypothetical protein